MSKRMFNKIVVEEGGNNKRQKTEGDDIATSAHLEDTESDSSLINDLVLESTATSDDNIDSSSGGSAGSRITLNKTEDIVSSETIEKMRENSKEYDNSEGYDGLFDRAEKYIDQIEDELNDSNTLVYSSEQRAKVYEDMLDADVAVRIVEALWVHPESMNIEKNEKLASFIDSNNRGEFANEAVVKFLTNLYGLYGEDFKDFNKSWHDSLIYINQVSNNQQLLGLVEELFTVNVQELGKSFDSFTD